MQSYHNIFREIVAPQHLFHAWEAFRKGKSNKPDVQRFERLLESNIFALHRDLTQGTYRHGPYKAFSICDPKPRRIHKASVRDRVVHHAIFSALEPLFDPGFYSHSYSCRKGKGTHRAMRRLHGWLRRISRNNHCGCVAIQCDVHRFFATVAHPVLLELIARRIRDADSMRLVSEIVGSFHTDGDPKRGLPLGNLTSQLFANIYLHELDMFVKHRLRVRHYLRYTDDFVIVGHDRDELEALIGPIRTFLRDRLRLDLHPRKVTIRKFRQGIDFLGYVLLPHHRVVRTRTWRRMERQLRKKHDVWQAGATGDDECRQSLHAAFGVLSHADSYGRRRVLEQRYQLWIPS